MTVDTANEPCTCGCGAHLETSEYGPVCTCQCEAELKPHTAAQEIYELRGRLEAIELELRTLTEAKAAAA